MPAGGGRIVSLDAICRFVPPARHKIAQNQPQPTARSPGERGGVMGWRKLEDTYLDHPKFKRLGRKLPPLDDVPPETVRLWAAKSMISDLWACALRYAPDGAIEIEDWPDICELINWPNEPQDLLAAMQAVGFLDRKDNIILIRNWLSRGGSYAEVARKRSERKRKAREDDLSEVVPDGPGQIRTVQDKSGLSRNVRLRRE